MLSSAAETKTDPRVKRTRHMLREALLALIEEKGFEAITVGDITQRAGLNRVTFYLHYHDKWDLLERSIDDVREELEATAGPPVDLYGFNADEPPPTLVRFFEHVGEHADFYRIMLGKDGVPSVALRIRANIEQFMLTRITAKFPAEVQHRVPLTVICRANAAAHVGVIQWWLEQRQPHSAATMARWLWQLTMHGTLAALEHGGE